MLHDVLVMDGAAEVVKEPPFNKDVLVKNFAPQSRSGCQYLVRAPGLMTTRIDGTDARKEFEEALSWVSAVADGKAAAVVQEVKDTLEPIMLLDSAHVQETHRLLTEAWEISRYPPEDFADLKTHDDAWNGDAADEFFGNFYQPLHGVRQNHAKVVHELAKLLGATNIAIDRIQQDILSWLDGEEVTLKAILATTVAKPKGTPSYKVWKRIGAITSVVGPVLASPTNVGAGLFQAVAALPSAIGELTEPEVVTGQASPAPDTIVNYIPEQAAELRRDFFEAGEAITAEATKILSEIHGHQEYGDFAVRRPSMADGVDGRGFHHRSVAGSYD
ncbi:hypothetical protein [Amycolatopsis sp. EV170708-02-1]|uniref:hypothetical protein n=1 Tax=Amycolatopsis sp. EV170708-02-1 TaxID=2919322 RepID=UPI001F0B951D|nr:hypothetical protein [Amycolatopsis sp. EV170708-02-1]UMP00102.1 hypothetical protein MJQ72_26770 [Amycolatopsis sp. EV170708-02-1]